MGAFIGIEGGDGSGKATQAELLSTHFRETLGKEVLKLSFPQYGTSSAYFAEQYLNGAYGENADEVPAELASLAYALDRYAASSDIRKTLAIPDSVIISDRFVASNLAHQGSKFSDMTERHAFYDRMLHTEHEILGIPQPDLSLVLVVPTKTAQQNVDSKETRSYTERKRDIHEADASHLDRTKANYLELTELYPDQFTPVFCTDEKGEMRTRESIQAEIFRAVQHLL